MVRGPNSVAAQLTLAAATRLGPYEIRGLLGAGGWGRSTAPSIPASGARWRSRSSRGGRPRPGPARALRARGPRGRRAQPSQHPHRPRRGRARGDALRRHGAARGGDAAGAARAARPDAASGPLARGAGGRGLEAAHAKGILHRDLKPENLFLTTDGRLKILDFGLAKLVAGGTAGSQEATASSPSRPGQLLGTVGYMSPEQVRGLPLDGRTDLFSLGVVLYELLGGSHPFRRETAVATLTAILEETPPELSAVSPALGGIVRRCLEKAPDDRIASAHDLAVALEAIQARAEGRGPPAGPRGARTVPGPALLHGRGRRAFLRPRGGDRGPLGAAPGTSAPRRDRALGGGQDVVRASGRRGDATLGMGGGGHDARDLAPPDAGPGARAGAGRRPPGAATARAVRGPGGGVRGAPAMEEGARRGAPRGGPARGALHAEPEGGAGRGSRPSSGGWRRTAMSTCSCRCGTTS